MAILFTGFETGHPSSDRLGLSTGSYVSAPVRTGRFAYRCDGGQKFRMYCNTNATVQAFQFEGCILLNNLPQAGQRTRIIDLIGVTYQDFQVESNPLPLGEVFLRLVAFEVDSDGRLYALNNHHVNPVTERTQAGFVTAGEWLHIYIAPKIGYLSQEGIQATTVTLGGLNPAVEILGRTPTWTTIDSGEWYGTGANESGVYGEHFDWGWIDVGSISGDGVTMWADDFAWCVDDFTTQNTHGFGTVQRRWKRMWFLRPREDVRRGSWIDNSGDGDPPLWPSVDNLPPVGTFDLQGEAGRQVRASSGDRVDDSFAVACETPTEAGIPMTEIIGHILPIVVHAQGPGGPPPGRIDWFKGGFSQPVSQNKGFTFGQPGGGVASWYPNGWTTGAGNFEYVGEWPDQVAVPRGIRSIIEVAKTDAGTAEVALLGFHVASEDANGVTVLNPFPQFITDVGNIPTARELYLPTLAITSALRENLISLDPYLIEPEPGHTGQAFAQEGDDGVSVTLLGQVKIPGLFFDAEILDLRGSGIDPPDNVTPLPTTLADYPDNGEFAPLVVNLRTFGTVVSAVAPPINPAIIRKPPRGPQYLRFSNATWVGRGGIGVDLGPVTDADGNLLAGGGIVREDPMQGKIGHPRRGDSRPPWT